MFDTSVLVAGISGLEAEAATKNPSAELLRPWLDEDTFVWLVSSEILDEYTDVLARLGVRRAVIGKVVNLLRAEAELIEPARTVGAEPDPDDEPFWACAEIVDVRPDTEDLIEQAALLLVDAFRNRTEDWQTVGSARQEVLASPRVSGGFIASGAAQCPESV